MQAPVGTFTGNYLEYLPLRDGTVPIPFGCGSTAATTSTLPVSSTLNLPDPPVVSAALAQRRSMHYRNGIDSRRSDNDGCSRFPRSRSGNWFYVGRSRFRSQHGHGSLVQYHFRRTNAQSTTYNVRVIQ